MIFSQNQIFSDKQAVTTTNTKSTNTLDLGAKSVIPFTGTTPKVDHGAGSKIVLGAFVTTDFIGLTSLAVELQGSDTVDGSGNLTSPVTISSTGAVPVAELEAGYSFNLDIIPTKSIYRYVQLNYVVAGTATAGNIMAGIVPSKDEGH